MKNRFVLAVMTAMLVTLGRPASAQEEQTGGESVGTPAPPEVADAGADDYAKRIAESVQRGAEILLERQESLDPRQKKSAKPAEWPYEGVYRVGGEIPIGYRIGGTSICAMALLEVPGWDESKPRREAVSRALDFVLAALRDKRMGPGFEVGYDVRGWGHTYALLFLLRLEELQRVPSNRRSTVDKTIRSLITLLHKGEILKYGGWNYSRRRDRSGRIAASTFMTAPTLQALFIASANGKKVDPRVIDRGLDSLEEARLDNSAFQYATNPDRRSEKGFEAVEGAIARMPVCETTLALAGRGSVDRIRESLDAFFEHWEWLEKRRRQNGTHIPPFMIAPYYFYYAHYYTAQAIEMLPVEERPEYRKSLYDVLYKVREESGGWNDRVFDRSENFGTAMVLLALRQPETPLPPKWDPESTKSRRGL